MEAKIKHLEMIQGVVSRLASNSFRLKGWSVVLVAALVAVLAREGRIDFIYVALVPVLVFWGLDGYFLWQERLFRALYDRVRVLRDDEIDFSMDVRPLRVHWGRSWPGAALSLTLIVFYGALIVAVALIWIMGDPT